MNPAVCPMRPGPAGSRGQLAGLLPERRWTLAQDDSLFGARPAGAAQPIPTAEPGAAADKPASAASKAPAEKPTPPASAPANRPSGGPATPATPRPGSAKSATATSGSAAAASRLLIGDLTAGMRVDDQIFMVAQKDLRTQTNGGLYIHLVFRDRSGQMPARIWQASEPMYAQIPDGGFIHVRGRCEAYRGSLQFIVDGFRPASRSDIDMGDFLPRTPRDQDMMMGRLYGILRGLTNEDCRDLAQAFLADVALMDRFKQAPAAMQMHHAYIGGLLEHTVNLLELALVVCPLYPGINQDLVLLSLFLHDIGKTYELTWDSAFAYSDGGQLVGHVVKAAVWVEQRAAQVSARRGRPVPTQLVELLQHLILSHHGQLAFGAARLPATAEAMLIHLLDNIDAKVHQFQREIAADPDKESHFTQYVKALETKIYKLDPTTPN